MLRREILNGIDEVSRLLETEGMAYIESLGQGGKPDRANTLRAYREIANAVDAMGASGRALLDALGLGALAELTSWLSLVQLESDSRKLPQVPEELRNLHAFVGVAQSVVPRLRLFVLNDALAAELAPGRNAQIFTVTLYDDGPRPNAPERVVAAVTSVMDVFAVVARLVDGPPSSLELIGLDSGSDHTFNFLGPEKIISEVRRFFTEVFDRVMFLRQRKASVEMSNTDQALSLLERINSSERENRISAEEAEILRRKIIGARAKALEAGVVPPDFVLQKAQTKSLSASREPKLLTSAEDSGVDE